MDKRNLDIKQVYGAIVDCWALYKSYAGQKPSEEVVEKIQKDAKALSEKYGKHEFAVSIICAVVTEVNNAWKCISNEQ